MHTLYFTRKFTKGHLLAGLVHHDKISFPTVEGCMQWLAGVTKHAKRNRYVIVDKSFQNYQR